MGEITITLRCTECNSELEGKLSFFDEGYRGWKEPILLITPCCKCSEQHFNNGWDWGYKEAEKDSLNAKVKDR